MFKAVMSPQAERTLRCLSKEDADKEPGPDMLVDFSWAETKRFFVASVGAMIRV